MNLWSQAEYAFRATQKWLGRQADMPKKAGREGGGISRREMCTELE